MQTIRNQLARTLAVAAAAATLVLLAGCATSADTPHDFRKTIASAKESVFPALVYVRVVSSDLDSGKNNKAVSSGSGVVITPDGELLTNHHVIDKATEIRCLLADGSSYEAEVVGDDKDLDIAVLRLRRGDATAALPYAVLSTNTVSIGDVVLAMGAPWGLARSVSMGIISCTDRYLEGCGQYTLWYQTDAAISPGNSGGPLVDTEGRVVGINARGVTLGAQAFTIPSPIILEVLPNLRKYGNAHWSWFGFRFQPLHDFDRNIRFAATNGVIVSGTDPASPAREAGVQPNDRIVAIDGMAVDGGSWESLPAIERELGRRPVGTKVRFEVDRAGRTLTFEIAPREKGAVEGEEKVFPRWGFTAKEINAFANPELAFFAKNGGVFVSAVAWDGNAERAKLKERDIIVSIDGKGVKTISELDAVYEAALKGLPSKTQMSLGVMRGGRRIEIVLNYMEDTEKESL